MNSTVRNKSRRLHIDEEDSCHSRSSVEQGVHKNFPSKSDTSPDSTETEVILADKEAREVKRIRILIILVILMSAIGAVSVYFYTKNVENKNFEQKFYDDANKVFASLGTTLEKALGGLDTLALSIASNARRTNQTFPFATMLDYPLYASRSMSLTKGMYVTYGPIVTFDQRLEWEKYMARNQSNDSPSKPSLLEQYVSGVLKLQQGWDHYYGPKLDLFNWNSSDVIYGDFGPLPYYNKSGRGTGVPDVYMPEWHDFPLTMDVYYPAGFDLFSLPFQDGLIQMMENYEAFMTAPIMIPRPDNPAAVVESTRWCPWFAMLTAPGSSCMEPVSTWFYPVMDSYDEISISDQPKENATTISYSGSSPLKGVLNCLFYWRELLKDILPDSSKGMVLVTENSCVSDTPYTYQIDGPNVKYLGVGDFHQRKYDKMTLTSAMYDLKSYRQGESDYYGVSINEKYCPFIFTLYASEEMKQEFETNAGIIFAVSAAAFVLFPFFVFIVYDRKVSKQQMVLAMSANRSNAIINSLFPSTVRDKLYPMSTSDSWLLNSDSNESDVIADLYPDTTVIFVDISGFTVWSSVRDPFQVFTLLEHLYGAYDKVAIQRKIFKVETVGDSYIAVCGLPTPNKNHAVVMAKFAKEILLETNETVMKLEKRLGPGTGDLRVRVGLNSGPTTAGVLRGAKGRFQLFGDTVNTAARMERNSVPGRIMCTEKTANLLVAAGKHHWLTRRDELVNAKGKGLLTCYWVNPKVESEDSVSNDVLDMNIKQLETKSSLFDSSKFVSDQQRLVDWMTEMFVEMLQAVVLSRESTDSSVSSEQHEITFLTPREEVTETIALPLKAPKNAMNVKGNENLNDPIGSEVKAQIREYITKISHMYQPNPFHNFEHACHVVMAAKKLLNRIVKPDFSSASATAYGITSDPLTQFAIIFSALIHDVDHPGVPNAQLVKERNPIAIKYHDLSVAEQNSVTIAWDILMEPIFADFRNMIMSDEVECRQFRQLLVNSVMATDLFDKDLKTLRDNRWKSAFHDEASASDVLSEQESNRRATIVIEHVIQAADISHTMQHWHVYQKWNKRLLHEMYAAYVYGRSEKDPSVGWYDGELWFFDNYIIPLAKKLKTCGVFGVSCDELLDYAMENRAEWASKGRKVVEESMSVLKKTCSRQGICEGHDDVDTEESTAMMRWES